MTMLITIAKILFFSYLCVSAANLVLRAFLRKKIRNNLHDMICIERFMHHSYMSMKNNKEIDKAALTKLIDFSKELKESIDIFKNDAVRMFMTKNQEHDFEIIVSNQKIIHDNLMSLKNDE